MAEGWRPDPDRHGLAPMRCRLALHRDEALKVLRRRPPNDSINQNSMLRDVSTLTKPDYRILPRMR